MSFSHHIGVGFCLCRGEVGEGTVIAEAGKSSGLSAFHMWQNL